MQLTPQQRIAAYEWAAERIVNNSKDPFICILLGTYMRDNYNFLYDSSMEFLKKYFPEFGLFEKTKDCIWFSESKGVDYYNEARLFILGSCILMAGGEL
jgi:hypothetical protein